MFPQLTPPLVVNGPIVTPPLHLSNINEAVVSGTTPLQISDAAQPPLLELDGNHGNANIPELGPFQGDSDRWVVSMSMESFLRGGAELASEQQRDPWIESIINRLTMEILPDDEQERAKLLKCEHKFVIDENGILRRVTGNTTGLDSSFSAVLPEHLVSLALYYFHDDQIGGHRGAAKTYVRLQRCFYFWGIYPRTFTYCRSCMTCQIMKKGAMMAPHPGFIDSDIVGAPGLVWQVDCTKLSRTSRNKPLIPLSEYHGCLLPILQILWDQ